MTSTKSGFTLMEMVIAVAIMGLFLAFLGPRLMTFLGTAKDTKAKQEIKAMKDAIVLSYGTGSAYPATLIDLTTGARPPLDPGGATIKEGKLVDPWDQPYQYRLTRGGKHPFELYSLGDPDAPERFDAWTK